MTAIDDLRADIERVIASDLNLVAPLRHIFRNGPVNAGELIDSLEVLLAQEVEHVSERVVAMLTEKWGLRESVRRGFHSGYDEHQVWHPGQARLVTDWREDGGSDE